MRISDWSSDVCSSDLACSLVAALVGDDEYAKIVLRHDVDVGLGTGHATMMRIVNALQVVAADDVPEIADAELGIEFDEGMMRFRHDRPTGQLEFEVLHHFRSEEHTSELQSLMRISYAVFCLKKKKTQNQPTHHMK